MARLPPLVVVDFVVLMMILVVIGVEVFNANDRQQSEAQRDQRLIIEQTQILQVKNILSEVENAKSPLRIKDLERAEREFKQL